MAYDYQIAKMITSKLLKVKLKSNTRRGNLLYILFEFITIAYKNIKKLKKIFH